MTDASGTIVWSADYKPFGEATVTVSTITNNLRFPGQYFDAETGLNYNYYRDYNPVIGRYIEKDPIGLRGGINLYVYVANNPVKFRDPLGLSTTVIVTYDYGGIVGSHSAIYIDTPGSEPFLYDPAGSYQPGREPRPGGGFFTGSDADLQKYILYHMTGDAASSGIVLIELPTTPEQEQLIRARAEEIGDPRGLRCASAVSSALEGICGIEPTLFPGNWPGSLAKQAKKAKCK